MPHWIKKGIMALALIAGLGLVVLSVAGYPSQYMVLLATGGLLGTWVATIHSLPRLSNASGSSHRSPASKVALLGLLAGLAALLQCSPAFVPGFGLLLAAFSSVPVAIGTLAVPDGAPAMVGAATALLVVLQLEEAFIFALTTAPLGVMVACSLLNELPWWKGILFPGTALGSGIILMSYLVGIPSLGPAVHGLGPLWAPIIYLGFGYAYASLWIGMLRLYRRFLRRLMAV